MDLPHVPAFLHAALKSAAILGAYALLFVPLERLFALRRQPILRPQLLTDLGYYFLNGALLSMVLSLPLTTIAHLSHRWLPGLAAATAQWPMWHRAAATMVVGELGFYLGHRLSHEIPLLWRFHAIHHSAERLDWLVNVRAHPVDVVFTRLVGFAPIFALGLADPLSGQKGLLPLLVLALLPIWTYFIHANVAWRFGWLEYVIATPRFHHWHHTNDGPDYVDRNYASLFAWIDWLFGTLLLPKGRMPERYGIEAPMPAGLAGQLLHPFDARGSARPAARLAEPS